MGLSSSSSPYIFIVSSLCLSLALIIVLWTLLWRFVLEPNPIVREFFELDKDTKEVSRTKHSDERNKINNKDKNS